MEALEDSLPFPWAKSTVLENQKMTKVPCHIPWQELEASISKFINSFEKKKGGHQTATFQSWIIMFHTQPTIFIPGI